MLVPRKRGMSDRINQQTCRKEAFTGSWSLEYNWERTIQIKRRTLKMVFAD
jgi:hypothetical protein